MSEAEIARWLILYQGVVGTGIRQSTKNSKVQIQKVGYMILVV